MRKLQHAAAGIIIFNSRPIRTHTIIALLIMMIITTQFFDDHRIIRNIKISVCTLDGVRRGPVSCTFEISTFRRICGL